MICFLILIEKMFIEIELFLNEVSKLDIGDDMSLSFLFVLLVLL